MISTSGIENESKNSSKYRYVCIALISIPDTDVANVLQVHEGHMPHAVDRLCLPAGIFPSSGMPVSQPEQGGRFRCPRKGRDAPGGCDESSSLGGAVAG